MLTIFGKRRRPFCDGVTRRGFLQVGGLAMGGMALPQILRAESSVGIRQSNKACIMIFLPGGPPHQDMWEIKTEAPSEIRGPFNPIHTSVPGIEICELFPRIARTMENYAIIRSVVGCDGEHASFQCNGGWTSRQMAPNMGHTCVGSAVSKLLGPIDAALPPFVGLAPKMGHMPWANPGEPGFLNKAYAPFKPDGEGMANMALNGVTLDRLGDRKTLLGAMDRFRRQADASGMMEGMDSFNQRAFEVFTSPKLVEALDIEKEDPALRERYGRGFNENKDDGGPRLLDNFLVARRLVSAGVRCVTLAFSRWDWHGNNFGQAKTEMPMLDQGVSALVEDLARRDMLDDVSVLVWGEFGRTPKINKDGGRDHWPPVSCALLAGGGIRAGQVIGSTNRLGEVPKDRPVHLQEVLATVYHNMGIDPRTTTIADHAGRPQYLLDHREPVQELV